MAELAGMTHQELSQSTHRIWCCIHAKGLHYWGSLCKSALPISGRPCWEHELFTLMSLELCIHLSALRVDEVFSLCCHMKGGIPVIDDPSTTFIERMMLTTLARKGRMGPVTDLRAVPNAWCISESLMVLLDDEDSFPVGAYPAMPDSRVLSDLALLSRNQLSRVRIPWSVVLVTLLTGNLLRDSVRMSFAPLFGLVVSLFCAVNVLPRGWFPRYTCSIPLRPQ